MFRTAAPPAVPSSFGNVSSSAHASSSASGSVAHHPVNKALARYPHRLNFYTLLPFTRSPSSSSSRGPSIVLKCWQRSSRHRLVTEPTPRPGTPSTRLPRGCCRSMQHRHQERRSAFRASQGPCQPLCAATRLCRSEDLRRRFVKAESLLFRLRFETDDATEREIFMRSLNLDWNPVSGEENAEYRASSS